MNRGFTLIELLTVIAIIAVLAGMLFPAIGMIRDRVRTTATQQRIIQIGNACEAYKALNRRYPAEQGVTWTAAVPSWTVGFASEHRECISYAASQSSTALGDVLERTADLLIPAEGLSKGDPIAGMKQVVDGWGNPLRYQRVDELAPGALQNRAQFWTARPQPPALAGLPGKREGFVIYGIGKGVPLASRTPADPAADTAVDPGRYWNDAKTLIYRKAGE